MSRPNPGARPDVRDVVAGAVQDLRVGDGLDAARRGSRRGAARRGRDAQAPPPRHAHQRSSRAGASMTAACSSPSRSTASSVPNSGTPADEVVGAVDRVDVPADGRVRRPRCRTPRRPGRGRGRRRAIRAADHRARWPCRPGSRTSDRAWSRSARSRRKCARAIASASSQAASATSSQPRSSASVPRRRSRGPVGPNRGPLTTRIRSPVGSYSGSRATSNPIHSPNTSTSPRVPIAARPAAGRRRRSSARPRSRSRPR